MENERRSSGYLITGLVIGLLIGIFYSRVIAPSTYIDTFPTALDKDSKDHYRAMVAMAYQYNNDLGRARGRINVLGDELPARALLDQAQEMLTNNGSLETVNALKVLSGELTLDIDNMPPAQDNQPPQEGEDSSNEEDALNFESEQEVALAQTETVGPEGFIRTATNTPPPLPTSIYTFTPRPSMTPLAVLDDKFVLKQQEEICDASLPLGLLQIIVEDGTGDPIPGALVRVSWQGGEESFFTGLYPVISSGYADYEMTEDGQYRVQIGTGGVMVSDLGVPFCTADNGDRYSGGLYLRFAPSNQSINPLWIT